MDKTSWVNPLPESSWSLPIGRYQQGGFGSRRNFNVNTGIDIKCGNSEPILAVQDGKVVKIERTKQLANVFIEGPSGVVVYCKVVPEDDLEFGIQIFASEIIGYTNNNNLRLELYSTNTRKRVRWSNNFPKPPQILDPTNFLLETITKTETTSNKTQQGIKDKTTCLNKESIKVLIGMSFREAHVYIAQQGWTYRISSINGKAKVLTRDYKINRLNLTIKNHLVTNVTIG